MVEISRLQNSLTHLENTQIQLREALRTSLGDPELTQALEENEVVMYAHKLSRFISPTIDCLVGSGSQKERISMLIMVLTEKGVSTSSAHYNLVSPSAAQLPSLNGHRSGNGENSGARSRVPVSESNEEENGVYL